MAYTELIFPRLCVCIWHVVMKEAQVLRLKYKGSRSGFLHSFDWSLILILSTVVDTYCCKCIIQKFNLFTWMRNNPANPTENRSGQIVGVVESDVNGHVEYVHQFSRVFHGHVLEDVRISLLQGDEGQFVRSDNLTIFSDLDLKLWDAMGGCNHPLWMD